ncbi:hypothetical protein D9M70_296820 [compost metagenome]
MAVVPRIGADRHQGLGQGRVATGAGIGAEIEVRQPAVEQARDEGADRVRIEQQRVAELGLHPRQLVGNRLVVRRPDLRQVARALRGRRLLAFAIERLAVEQRRRVEAGGRGGVERRVVGRAIEVDDVARILRRQGARPQIGGEIVEARDVPVGVGEVPAGRHHAGFHRRGQVRAGVRHADQQRRTAAAEAENVIHSRSPVRVESPAWAGRRPTSRRVPPGAGCPRR